METRVQNNKVYEMIKQIDLLQIVYLCLFVAYVVRKYLESTALEWSLPANYEQVIRMMMIAFVIIRVLEQIWLHKTNMKEIAVMIVIVAVSAVSAYFSNEIMIFDLALFIVGAKGVEFKKICFTYLCVAIIIQILALILVNQQYIPDYVYNSGKGIRHSLGICYPTDLAAHVLFISLVYICFRNKKITFFEITAMFVVSLWVYNKTYARNDLICMLAMCVLAYIVKGLQLGRISLTKYKKIWIVSFAVVLLFIVSMLIAVFYSENNQILLKLNQLLENRLSLSSIAYHNYGFSLFGKQIAEVGMGFGTAWTENYFFIDSSYARIVLKYGIVFAIMVSALYVAVFKKAVEYKRDFYVVALLITLLFAINEHHFYELSFNPIWLMLFSRVYKEKKA